MGSLRLKRGDSTDRLNYTPLEGELILDTDTQQLFIGDGVTAGGNAVVAGNANVTIVSNYSNANVAAFLPVYSGNITADVITANSITGLTLSSVPAANLFGTIPDTVLGNSSLYIGTTQIHLNRANANIELTGIDSINKNNMEGAALQFAGNARVPVPNVITPGSGYSYLNGNYTALGGDYIGNVYYPEIMSIDTKTFINGELLVQFEIIAYSGVTCGITGADLINNANGAAVLDAIVANSTISGMDFHGIFANTHSVFQSLTAGNMCVADGNLDVPYGWINGSLRGTADEAQIANYVTQPTQSNITAVGTLTGLNINGNLSVTGNVSNVADLTMTGNISGVSNIVKTTGNIKFMLGGAEMLSASNAGFTFGGNVNINSGGTGLNNLIVAGNVTGNVFSGNGSGLTNLTGANVTGTVPSANVADYVQLVATNNTATTHYINFTNSATANSQIRTDTSLTYNPDTNTLTVGSVTGTASKANIARITDYSANAYTFVTSLTRNGSANLNSSQATDGFGVTQDLMTMDWFVGENGNTGFFTEAYGNLRVKGSLIVSGTGSNANGFIGGDFVSNTVTTKDLTVTGNIGGSFSTNSVAVTNTASSTSHYIPFITGNTSGTYSLYNDAGIRYVPSNNSFNLDGNINAVQGFYSGNITTSGGLFGSPQSTKANNSTGTAGQIAWDANYIYVCTATNTWKRVSLTAF